jgi:hypothetical protein
VLHDADSRYNGAAIQNNMNDSKEISSILHARYLRQRAKAQLGGHDMCTSSPPPSPNAAAVAALGVSLLASVHLERQAA